MKHQNNYHANVLLEKNFIIDVDYKTAPENSGAVFELENTLSQEKIC
jgi:hypothetical protein